jgi:hypothetical protein
VLEEPAAAVRKDIRPTRRRTPSRGLAAIEIELTSGERMRVEVPADADLVAGIVVALRRT